MSGESREGETVGLDVGEVLTSKGRPRFTLVGDVVTLLVPSRLWKIQAGTPTRPYR